MSKKYKMPELENIKVAFDKVAEETKEFLQKPRYEYYKGTTEVIDNELDNFVEDVVDRLNEQYFTKGELLKVKQNQDKQIADLQHRLEVAEKALDLACQTLYDINFQLYNTEMDFKEYFKQQAKEMLENE